MENEFKSDYEFIKLLPLKGTHGMALLSKFPIEETYLLNNHQNRPYAAIHELSLGKQKVRIINSHLASPAIAVENPSNFFELYHENYDLRKEQIMELDSLMEIQSGDYDFQLMVGT